MTPPALSDSEQLALLRAVFDTMDDGVMVVNSEFDIILANNWIESRHADAPPAAGLKCYNALFGRHDKCPACPLLRSLDKGTPQKQVVKSLTREGRADWFELCAFPLRDPSGAPARAIEHVKGIAGRKQLEEQLRDEIVQRQLLIDQSPDGVVGLDLDGKVSKANEQFARMLGYTMEEIHQLHIWDWDAHPDQERLLHTLERAEAARDHFETSYRRKDGTLLQVEVFSAGANLGGKAVVFHLCRDITEKKALQKQTREIGVRDPLTDVYNGRYIFERLAEISAEHGRKKGDFYISFLDIDNFRSVNAFHGIKAGDLALKAFASTISAAIRPYDLLGRYSGEEFILVSRNATAAETASMMERITRMVREMVFRFEGHRIRLTLSCGLAHSSEFPHEAFSIDAMVSCAERRLNEAKASGRDRWVGPPRVDDTSSGMEHQVAAD